MKNEMVLGSNAEIFTKIYKQNEWGGEDGQFFSGSGSHNAYVPGYAQVVFEFIKKNSVRKIVEIGCGDFYVTNIILKLLDNNKIAYDYLGYVCVSELIDFNYQRYSAYFGDTGSSPLLAKYPIKG